MMAFDPHFDDHSDDEPVAPCPALPPGTRRGPAPGTDDDDPVIEPDEWPARPLAAPVTHPRELVDGDDER